MTKKQMELPADITIHTKRSMPSFYEEAAVISDPESDDEAYRVGRSSSHPFIFYIFSSRDELNNGTFVATIDISPLIMEFVEKWPEVRDAALAPQPAE